MPVVPEKDKKAGILHMLEVKGAKKLEEKLKRNRSNILIRLVVDDGKVNVDRAYA